MTAHDNESTLLADIRNFVRELQLAVYRMGMSGRYHLGKARDMLSDIERIELSTDVPNPSEHQQRLPNMIAEIERLDELAQEYWERTRKNDDTLVKLQSALNDAYDALCLRPRNYERLVRQSDKPILADAKSACERAADDPGRVALENMLRMGVEDYVRLEHEISRVLAEIDRLRDSFAETYRDFANEYVRSITDGNQMSLAAGYLGMRLAVCLFDDRRGFQFVDYATPWIDRELSRIGEASVGQPTDERESE